MGIFDTKQKKRKQERAQWRWAAEMRPHLHPQMTVQGIAPILLNGCEVTFLLTMLDMLTPWKPETEGTQIRNGTNSNGDLPCIGSFG